MQVTPVVTRNAKFVVLDVHSRVNLLGETPKPAPAKAGGLFSGGTTIEQIVAVIDRPALQSQRLATTLRVPVGKPSLIGGMTFAAEGEGPANLYLFITASVQELRDDEGLQVKPDDKPVAGEAKKDAGGPAAPAKAVEKKYSPSGRIKSKSTNRGFSFRLSPLDVQSVAERGLRGTAARLFRSTPHREGVRYGYRQGFSP